jgi:hypothetical protein
MRILKIILIIITLLLIFFTFAGCDSKAIYVKLLSDCEELSYLPAEASKDLAVPKKGYLAEIIGSKKLIYITTRASEPPFKKGDTLNIKIELQISFSDGSYSHSLYNTQPMVVDDEGKFHFNKEIPVYALLEAKTAQAEKPEK